MVNINFESVCKAHVDEEVDGGIEYETDMVEASEAQNRRTWEKVITTTKILDDFKIHIIGSKN